MIETRDRKKVHLIQNLLDDVSVKYERNNKSCLHPFIQSQTVLVLEHTEPNGQNKPINSGYLANNLIMNAAVTGEVTGSKHDTLSQSWVNVGPALKTDGVEDVGPTLGQLWFNAPCLRPTSL